LSARSSISRRSGALIFRTSWLKIPFHGELADLGTELLDLALAAGLGIPADVGVESVGGVLQELLLPGVNLVRVDFVALCQFGDRRRFPRRLQGGLRLRPASILRLVFFVMVRSA
jgi:hypothetical protein